MLSRKIRSCSALLTSSVGIVMFYLIISQLIPYFTAGSWNELIRIAGGDDKDITQFFTIHEYSQLVLVLLIGALADLLQHRLVFLIINVAVTIAGFLWIDFYSRGNMTTLYWILWLSTGAEVSSTLIRSYLVGQTERRIERGRWLIRLVMIEWIIVTLSPTYPDAVGILNEFIFGSTGSTTNVGYYLISFGVVFFLVFYFAFQTILQIYGKADLSQQGDVEDNTRNRANSNEDGNIWKGKKQNKKATVTAVVEYMLDFKEEEEKKALLKHQQEEIQAEKDGLPSLDNSVTINKNNYCHRISWKAIGYLIYLLTMCLTLHLTFQISFILFEKIIPILLIKNFEIEKVYYELIYMLANGLGLMQYYFLERFSAYRNITYYFMNIGIISFLIIIWIFIHGEAIFVFIYSNSQSFLSGNQTTQHDGPYLYSYIHVSVIIVGMMLAYAFSYPLTMMSNLITYSSIPVPSFTICKCGGTSHQTRQVRVNLNDPYQERAHAVGYNLIQAIYSAVSIFAILVADWILKFERISLSTYLTTLGEFTTNDPTQPNSVTGGLAVQDEVELLYYMLFFCSIHLLVLCASGNEFEWIFSTTRRQREILNSNNQLNQKPLSQRHWFGIIFAIVNIVYVIIMKRI